MQLLQRIEHEIFRLAKYDAQLPERPVKITSLKKVDELYHELESTFNYANLYVGVKALDEEVVEHLAKLGASFEVGSAEEIGLLRECEVPPERIIFSNTSFTDATVDEAKDAGITRFVVHSEDALKRLQVHAPGAEVIIRLATNVNEQGIGKSAQGFDERFGCNTEQAIKLCQKAQAMGLTPIGLSVHVGTQQENFTAWDATIEQAAEIFTVLDAQGIRLNVLDLGGGFPSRYKEDIPEYKTYSKHIQEKLIAAFGANRPEIIFEPGRAVAAMAAATVGEIIECKQHHLDPDRYVVTSNMGQTNTGIKRGYLTIPHLYRKQADGKFKEITHDTSLPTAEVDIYGMASTSEDKLLMGKRMPIPQVGDRLVLEGTAAYSKFQSRVCGLPEQYTVAI